MKLRRIVNFPVDAIAGLIDWSADRALERLAPAERFGRQIPGHGGAPVPGPLVDAIPPGVRAGLAASPHNQEVISQ